MEVSRKNVNFFIKVYKQNLKDLEEREKELQRERVTLQEDKRNLKDILIHNVLDMDGIFSLINIRCYISLSEIHIRLLEEEGKEYFIQKYGSVFAVKPGAFTKDPFPNDLFELFKDKWNKIEKVLKEHFGEDND